jgi:hypothetical protein
MQLSKLIPVVFALVLGVQAAPANTNGKLPPGLFISYSQTLTKILQS